MGEGVVRALGAVQSSTAVGLKPSLKCLGRALKISFSRLAQPLRRSSSSGAGARIRPGSFTRGLSRTMNPRAQACKPVQNLHVRRANGRAATSQQNPCSAAGGLYIVRPVTETVIRVVSECRVLSV